MRRDKREQRIDEHQKVKDTMGLFQVPTAPSTDPADLLPEDSYPLRMKEPPQVQKGDRSFDGKPPKDWFYANLQVTQGDYAGKEFRQRVNVSMGMKTDGTPSLCRSLVEALVGRPLEEGEDVDPNEVPWTKEIRGMVSQTAPDDQGRVYNRVIKFTRAPKPKPPQRPVAPPEDE